MMKWKRILSLLLMIVLVCSFVACGSASTLDKDTTEGDTESVAEPDSEILPDAEGGLAVFLKSDMASFKIAYSSELGKDALAEVQKLSARINSVCGIEITVTSDFIMSNNEQLKEWEHEILIGPTNREASNIFGADLRESDYGYGYVDGKIVISGGSSVAVKNAISQFMVDVIVGHSSSDVFYQSDWTKIEKKSYAVEQLSINGVSVKEYTIVYAKSAALFEMEMASRLQSVIVQHTGYSLQIRSDSEVQSAEKTFLIGKTKFSTNLPADVLNANVGCVVGNGATVTAYGDDVQGMVNSSKLLTDLLFDSTSTEKSRAVTIGEAQTFDGKDTFSVMTHNLKVGDVPSDRIERAMTLIYKYMPDTLGVQEAKTEWMNALNDRLSDYYAIVGEGREGGTKGEYNAILYAKAKYNLIESGTKWLTDTPDEVSKLPNSTYYRIFTWVLLEDKVTGERYLHVNTHLEGGVSQMIQVKCLMIFLKQYNDVPIVLTGDMNAVITADEMKYIQDKGFATKQDFSELDHLPLFGRGYSVIDWIFVTKDCMTLTNYVTDDNYFNGDYASDHCSYFAEFRIQRPSEGDIDHGWSDLDISLRPEGSLDETEDQDGTNYGELIRPK